MEIEDSSYLKTFKMKMNATIGLNLRLFQKPKRGFFGGLGATRQHYRITTQTEFGRSIFSNPYLWKETSDIAWGINSKFGYAYRLKKVRFEFLISHNYLFMEGREYEYHTILASEKTKARSINSDFGLSPISFEMRYIIDLF